MQVVLYDGCKTVVVVFVYCLLALLLLGTGEPA